MQDVRPDARRETKAMRALPRLSDEAGGWTDGRNARAGPGQVRDPVTWN